MSDRDGVIESMCRYGRACDTRDYELLDRCFTADTVVRYSRTFGGELHGRTELAGYLAGALGRLDATQHLFGNFEVDARDGRARFRCYVQATHVRAGGLFTVGGRYANEAVRGDDGLWRIALLDFEAIWTSGDPDVLGHIMPADSPGG